MKDSLNEKLVFRLVTGVSIFVFLIVVIINKRILPVPVHIPKFVPYLPSFYACINGLCTILLLTSLYFIKQKNIVMHKRINLLTFFLSCLFLVCYIIYHFYAKETLFPKHNPWRPLYLFILFTHIILSGLVLPLILLSFYYGLRMEVEKHKKLVRFTFPIWLYVTITGVVVYLMISPYYIFS